MLMGKAATRSMLTKRLGDKPGGVILEVGTGEGNFIPVLARCFKSFSSMVCIDIDESVLIKARARFKQGNIEFLKMDGSCINFEDGIFDTVCISNTLQQLLDVDTTLKEMKRVLKPGGCFIVNEVVCDGLNEGQKASAALLDLRARIERLRGGYHNKVFTCNTIVSHIIDAGINITDNFKYVPSGPGQDMAKLFKSFDILVNSVKDYGEYEDIKSMYELIKYDIGRNGYEFAPQLVVIGERAAMQAG